MTQVVSKKGPKYMHENNELEKKEQNDRHTITAKTPVLNSTPPVLWEVHTKLVLILTPVGVSLIPLGVKFNTDRCYYNTHQC